MFQFALFAQQAKMLPFNERFIIMPCAMMAMVVIFFVGLNRIREKRFTLKARHRWMYGKSEMTGKTAVISGYAFCFISAFSFLFLLVRIIDGRQ